ncbi:hypothetical protein KA005_21875 [bacterium]|nr:hypothetical protein [bacterium]
MKMLNKKSEYNFMFIILLAVSGFSGSANGTDINVNSAPEIKSVPISLVHGEIATITGNFSAKLTSSPVIWDDFENGADNKIIGNGWAMYDSNSGQPVYTSSDKYTGSLSVMNTIYGGSGTAFGTAWKEFKKSDEVYSSYLFKYTIDGANNNGNMKLARITSDYSGDVGNVLHYNGPGEAVTHFQPAATWAYFTYHNGNERKKYNLDCRLPADKWIRVEVYQKLSSPGKADGQVIVRIDNKLALAKTGIVTRADAYSFQMNSFLLPLMYANVKDGTTFSMYVDDVYLDTTLERVEIANCPVLNRCSKSEVQIPETWSSDSITFKVNLGTFEVTDSLYVFIIDSNGNTGDGVPVDQI